MFSQRDVCTHSLAAHLQAAAFKIKTLRCLVYDVSTQKLQSFLGSTVLPVGPPQAIYSLGRGAEVLIPRFSWHLWLQSSFTCISFFFFFCGFQTRNEEFRVGLLSPSNSKSVMVTPGAPQRGRGVRAQQLPMLNAAMWTAPPILRHCCS